MAISNRRLAMIGGTACFAGICFAVLPPIAQDPLYHVFADARTLCGIPNFWNVISNVLFFIAALAGVKTLRSRIAFVEPWERIAYGALIAGTAAVGLGSTYYHLHPCDARLFWDRLPMTVVFMSLLATTIGERVDMRAGKLLLLPMILLGAGTVLYWRFSGDLRLYVVVQFGSMLAMPLLLAMFPPRYSAAGRIWCTVILYVVAKIAELFDHEIASVVVTGGHPWKHVAAACAVFIYLSSVAARRRLPTPD